jgi:hypothetical protein
MGGPRPRGIHSCSAGVVGVSGIRAVVPIADGGKRTYFPLTSAFQKSSTSTRRSADELMERASADDGGFDVSPGWTLTE